LQLNKAFFFDRDGVINRDFGYTYRIEDFTFNEGFFELFLHLKTLGYLTFVITNQSGINRGYYTQEDFTGLTKHMQAEILKVCGSVFDGVYFCPHAPEERCECRKPKSGLLEQAFRDFAIDRERSWMIGDKESDLEAARAVGIVHGVLVNSNEPLWPVIDLIKE